MASLVNNIKYCPKCSTDRDKSFFNKSKKRYDGLDGWCKMCVKEKARVWNIKNNERILKKKKEYNATTIEKRKFYRSVNIVRIKEGLSKRKEEIATYMRGWKDSNKEWVKEYEKMITPNKLIKRKQRMAVDPLFKMKINLRSRIAKSFKAQGYKKNSPTRLLLGVPYEDAKVYIESLFTNGMNWGNYGEWHIDHIIPLSSARSEEELLPLFSVSNLQPLWALDNLRKSNKTTIGYQQIKAA